jgi:electron transport complex protein RnfB
MMVAAIGVERAGGRFGLLLGFAAVRFKVEGDPIVEKIDAILPQTQCGQCGFAGCRPYAEAIAAGEADINQCPPGGQKTAWRLAELLGRDPQAAQPDNGAEKPKMWR